jgi:hypothetical protein
VGATLANAGTFVQVGTITSNFVDAQNPRGDAGGGSFMGHFDCTALLTGESVQAIYQTRVLPGGPLRTAALGNTVSGPTPAVAGSVVGPCIGAETVLLAGSMTSVAAGRSLPWRHGMAGRLASLYQGSQVIGALNTEYTLQTIGFGGTFVLLVDCGGQNQVPPAGMTFELRAYMRAGAGSGGTLIRMPIVSASPSNSVAITNQLIFALGPHVATDTISYRIAQTAGALQQLDWRIYRLGF